MRKVDMKTGQTHRDQIGRARHFLVADAVIFTRIDNNSFCATRIKSTLLGALA
jgi:hypothetical protein